MLHLTAGNAQRIPQKRPSSPAMKRAQAQMVRISKAWGTLTEAQQMGFRTLGLSMKPRKVNAKRASLTGKQAFDSLNLALASCGITDILTDAPLLLDGPMPLPVPTLSAVRQGGNTGTFSLVLTSSAYAGMVAVYCTAAKSGGTLQPKEGAYTLIAAYGELPNGTLDITASFTYAFRQPPIGMRVFVRLVPVSQTGFRGMSQDVWAEVINGS